MPQVVKHQTGITSLPTEILFKIISLLPVDVCLQIIGSSCRTLSPLVLQSLHSARSHIKLQMAITNAASIYQYLSIRQLKGKRWLSLPVVYKFACYELLLTGDPHRAANMTIRASNDDDGESVLPTQEPEGHDGEVEWEEIDVEEDEDEADEDEDGYDIYDEDEEGEEDDLELFSNWPLTGLQCLQLAQILSRNNSFDIGCSNQRLFRWAVEAGHTKAVEILLKDNRIDPAVYENDPIASATRMGHVEITRLLLADSRVDPAVEKNTPIALACEKGHSEVVRILLQDPRVDPCDDRNAALEAACEHGHLEVVKVLLLDGRVDPGFNDSLAFQLAVQHNHLEVTSVLMENKRVDPSCGKTLINAIRHRNTEMVKLLLSDSRMDPTASSRLGMHQLRVGGYEILYKNTALIEAASQGSVEIMKLLLKHCRTKKTGNSFDHALLAAVLNDFPKIAKILLEDGRADPGYQNSLALIQASLRANVDMVRLLMEDGRSDPSTNMQEAFANACYSGSREMVELFAKNPRVNPLALWKRMANDRDPFEKQMMDFLSSFIQK